MGEKIAAAVFGLVFILFLLSVFAPMQSQRKFWRMIHKFRAGLDFVVYWFFNLCAISSILYVCFMAAQGLLKYEGIILSLVSFR